jgi:uncharacterized protein RhaS with RHS repeats
LNLYQYAPNPLLWIDPWGWCATGRLKVGREILPGSKIRRIRAGTNGKFIVIGRSMKRVIASAKKIGAEYWDGFDRDNLSDEANLANNRKWIEGKIAEGYSVVDIELDPEYVNKGGKGSKTKEDYYKMETEVAFGTKKFL